MGNKPVKGDFFETLRPVSPLDGEPLTQADIVFNDGTLTTHSDLIDFAIAYFPNHSLIQH